MDTKRNQDIINTATECAQEWVAQGARGHYTMDMLEADLPAVDRELGDLTDDEKGTFLDAAWDAMEELSEVAR